MFGSRPALGRCAARTGATFALGGWGARQLRAVGFGGFARNVERLGKRTDALFGAAADLHELFGVVGAQGVAFGSRIQPLTVEFLVERSDCLTLCVGGPLSGASLGPRDGQLGSKISRFYCGGLGDRVRCVEFGLKLLARFLCGSAGSDISPRSWMADSRSRSAASLAARSAA